MLSAFSVQFWSSLYLLVSSSLAKDTKDCKICQQIKHHHSPSRKIRLRRHLVTFFVAFTRNSGSSKLIELLLGEISQDEGIKVNTLGDLFVRLKMKLQFECLDCGCKWAPEADELLERFEHTTELKDVRCPCEKCDSMKVSAQPVSM